MGSLKMQAVEMIQDVPDDKLIYVIDILRLLNKAFVDKPIILNKRTQPMAVISTDSLEAWEGFKKYKGVIQDDIDEKAELARARDEKYESLN